MRIALAKLLLGRPNLLLLDEPTNHLDLEARNWLETYLNEYPHAVILVSHDRFFLDAVVTRIADLTLRTLTDYVGNYSDYLVAHEARIEQLRKASASRTRRSRASRCSSTGSATRRPRRRRCRAASRCSRRSCPIEVPPERKKIHFNFPPCAKSGRTVLEIKHARKAYGDLVVFDDLNLHIERGDRIALVGPNGSGKSTLMRMLSGEEAPDAGQRVEGHNVVMQYFAQDEATRLDPAPTVYETLASGSPLHMVPAIRNILGGFLFSGDDVYKPVRVLSGGERTRLAVARMLLRPSNTLLLDEPTNHLDLDSKEVLLDALVDYGGTLIFVSHDRYFVERLATKIIEVGSGTALVYPGTYTEFLWHKEHPSAGAGRHARRVQAAQTATRHAARVDPDRGGGSPRDAPGTARGRAPANAPKAPAQPAAPAAIASAIARATKAQRRRSAQEDPRRAGPTRTDRTARSAHRRHRERDPRDRTDDGRARLLRRPRRRPGHDRSAPGADVGGRRSDAPVGEPAVGLRPGFSRRRVTDPSVTYSLCDVPVRCSQRLTA